MKVIGTTLSVLALLAVQSVASAQGTFDRTKPPELGPPPRVSLPPILTRQLPNGLKLIIVEQHELPLADFVLLVGSGGTVDPAGKTGVANLTSSMLREGTTSRKSWTLPIRSHFSVSTSLRQAVGNPARCRSTRQQNSWTVHSLCLRMLLFIRRFRPTSLNG